MGKLLTIIVFVFIFSFSVKAQIEFSSYFDFGGYNSSDGNFFKTAVFGESQWNRTALTGGVQLDLKSRNENVFSGINIKVNQGFAIHKFPFELEGLFLYNRFSELVHESNWSLLAKIDRKHFSFKLGTHFRTYSVTEIARERYAIESDNKIHENWNIIYLIQYNLKSMENPWNIGLGVTNIDHFVISQETNPSVNLKGSYRLSASFVCFAEAWLKSAGLFNISVNSFGYFFRMGLIWEIGTRK